MSPTDELPTPPLDYKKFNRQLFYAVWMVNIVGAMFTFFYLAVIDPTPTGEDYVNQLGFLEILFFIGVMVVTLVVSLITGKKDKLKDERIERYYNARLKDIHCEVPEKVLKDILNYPVLAALQSFTMWILAGILITLVNYREPADMPRGFISIVGVGGILTAALCFFVLETLFQKIHPVFFPKGRLNSLRGVLRLSVPARLLLISLLMTLYPVGLLVLTSLERARQMLTNPNPQNILDNLILGEIFLVVVGIITSISLASFVARSLVRPLLQLQDGMLRVEQNDLNTQVSVLTPDELGSLADGFNDMVEGLKQGEMLRDLLNHYVSPEVAKMALESGAPLGGQLVECTTLFSDLRDFTGLSERLGPAEMINLLNRYMVVMVDVIVAQGGIVTRFGGDSILAVFGTPLNPAKDHALRAVRAALEMQRALVDFNRTQVETGGVTLKTGIGIATGQVIAGNVGGKQRMEYTVIGDPANLAARLQNMTKELGHQILLHGETYHTARQSLPLEAIALEPVNVRGKSAPVEVFALQ